MLIPAWPSREGTVVTLGDVLECLAVRIKDRLHQPCSLLTLADQRLINQRKKAGVEEERRHWSPRSPCSGHRSARCNRSPDRRRPQRRGLPTTRARRRWRNARSLLVAGQREEVADAATRRAVAGRLFVPGRLRPDLTVARLERRAPARDHGGAGGREIHVVLPIGYAIRRPIIAGGNKHRLSERGRILECLIIGGQRLLRPRRLRLPPTDGDESDARIVHRLADCLQKSLGSVRTKKDF